MKFYKAYLNYDSTRIIYKDFFGCLRTKFCNIWWFVKFFFFDPLFFGGYNFLNSIFFLMIFSVLDVPIEGFQVFLGH
jgi:hypothetical protein